MEELHIFPLLIQVVVSMILHRALFRGTAKSGSKESNCRTWRSLSLEHHENMQSYDQVTPVEKVFWDLIAGGLQNSELVKVFYVSYIVFNDLIDMSKRDSTIYRPSRISKKCKTAFNLNKCTIDSINGGAALVKVLKIHSISVHMKYIGGALT